MPTRFVFVISTPMPSPMGSIAMSTPKEKKPMPTISRKAPAKNKSSVPTGMGVIVKLINKTMPVIGSTEVRDSINFSLSFSFILSPRFC